MEPFTKKYFRLPREQIGFLRFILESYDGLAFARTLDSRLALVEVAYPHRAAPTPRRSSPPWSKTSPWKKPRLPPQGNISLSDPFPF